MVRQSTPEPRSAGPTGMVVRRAPESLAGDSCAAEQRADQMLREAFQALAGCEPPANAWPRLAARLNRRRRRVAAPAHRLSVDLQTSEAGMPAPRAPEPSGAHGGG